LHAEQWEVAAGCHQGKSAECGSPVSEIRVSRSVARQPAQGLRHVLARIADHQICRTAELLPWNVSLEEAGPTQAA
jgi:hypothetical protein